MYSDKKKLIIQRIEKDYYQNIRFKIYLKQKEKQEIELVDGGSTNWMQKLLNNTKECLIISGIGSERLCEIYQSDHQMKKN